MRLIDADALKQTFCAKCSCVGCENCNIDYHFEHLAPTVDAEIVKHGHWEVVDETEPRRYGCSVCKRLSYTEDNYCSYCGAKMDEVEDG